MKNPYPAYYPFFFVLVNVFICFRIYLKKGSKIKNKTNKIINIQYNNHLIISFSIF